MPFTTINGKQLARFNSDAASKLIDLYQTDLTSEIQEHDLRIPSQTIAPSSLRCLRKTWFRLRGTQPDSSTVADLSLDFKARSGDHCHQLLQSRLKKYLKDDWIHVPDYINQCEDFDHECEFIESGYETRIKLHDIPINFACDGIIRFDDKYYLLEIKSCEYSTFNLLEEPRDEHIAQITCYAALLHLPNVLIVYIDREYGELKCYEVTVKQYEIDEVMNQISTVIKYTESGLAPDGLPSGDKWCGMCNYYETCKEYGRF